MSDVAIVIPHYNDVTRLLRCLAALIPQAEAYRAEVIVVDNSSSQSLEPLRVSYPGLRIVTEPLKGAAAARNRGARDTTAAYLFFLDADCVPHPDWLETALNIRSTADVVGGRVSVFDETPAPRSGAEAFETVFAFDNRGYVENKGFSVTANLLTRRDVFEDVGEFVPGLSEDFDWCRRATGKGYSLVYDDTLHVSHPTRSDWAALHRKWQRINAESFGLIGTGVVARITWSLRGLAMPVSIVVHSMRILTTSRLHGMRERAAAFATLARLRIQRCGWMLRQALTGRA
ncbi:glycosyltransferase family 2 protein [Roseobacter litoralis]|uniref:Glycosyl transferase family 2 n=1 Tax=Roseobacter litoralis (strain ATCC 49566 / DSM 6996 / JCM 21268 / NBRC 15278 / OCh 149) TaxID=391595 RepID=F7ZMK9_ROSLO|nr:glycosyltransferase [Roseobacter litoralis]AEI96546.1 putative glycosyl transferase family 2 [Roseobacter litoralis Och 149]